MKYIYLLLLLYIYTVNSAPFIKSVAITPSILYANTIKPPSFNLEIIATPNGIASGYVKFCDTTFSFNSEACKDSGSTTIIDLCLPLEFSYIMGCMQTGLTNVTNLINIIRLDNNLFITDNFLPLSIKPSTFIYDIVSPIITLFSFKSVFNNIYVRFKASDVGSGVRYCHVTIVSGPLSFTEYTDPLPDIDGFFYVTLNVDISKSLTWSIQTISCYDYYSNRGDYTLNQLVTLSAPNNIINSVPSIVSYSFSPTTINDQDNTKQNTIKYTVEITDSFTPIYSIVVTMNSVPCYISYTSKNIIDCYCILSAYTPAGSYAPKFQLYTNQYNSTIATLSNNGSLVVSTNYATNYQITQQTLSYNKPINGLAPFTIQVNVSIYSGGIPFVFLKLNSLLTMTQDNLVSGTLTDGVFSGLFVYSSYSDYILNSTVYEFTSPVVSKTSVTLTGLPTSRPASIQPNIVLKSIRPMSNVDLTKPYPTPSYGVYSLKTNGVDFTNKLQIVEDYVSFDNIGQNNHLISGSRDNGVYLTGFNPSLSLISAFYGSGPTNLKAITTDGIFFSFSTVVLSQCFDVTTPKMAMPKVKTFDFNPKVVSVSNETQYITFTISLVYNYEIGEFDQVQIEFSQDVLLNKERITCTLSSLSPDMTIYGWTCFKPIPPQTFTYDYTFNIYVTYVNGYIQKLSNEYLISNSYPNSLRIVGQNPLSFPQSPIFRTLEYDPNSKQLTFKLESMASYLTSVSIVWYNNIITNSNMNLYSYSSRESPSKVIQAIVDLNIPCSSKSFKLSFMNVLVFTVKDYNGVKYSFSTPQLKEFFPRFDIPIQVCPDAFPPQLQSFSLTKSNLGAGNVYILNAKITDNFSGFKNMTISFESNLSYRKTVVVTPQHLQLGNSNNGVYVMDIAFPLDPMYTLSYSVLHLYDNYENDRPYLPLDFINMGVFPSISIETSTVLNLPEIVNVSSTSSLILGNKFEFNLTVNNAHQVILEISDYNGFFKVELDSSTNFFTYSYFPSYVGTHFFKYFVIGKNLQSSSVNTDPLTQFLVTSSGYTNTLPFIASIATNTANTYNPKVLLNIDPYQPSGGFNIKCALIDSNNQLLNGSYAGVDKVCGVVLPNFYSGVQVFKWVFYFDHFITQRSVYFSGLDLSLYGIKNLNFTIDFTNPTTTSSGQSTTTTTTTTASTTSADVNSNSKLTYSFVFIYIVLILCISLI